MKTQELITSYDEINDTFVSKIKNKNGFYADFDISDGIILAIDKNNLPTSIFVNNASDVFNVDKNIFDDSEILISIECDEADIDFEIFVGCKRIYYVKSNNDFEIPVFRCIMQN